MSASNLDDPQGRLIENLVAIAEHIDGKMDLLMPNCPHVEDITGVWKEVIRKRGEQNPAALAKKLEAHFEAALKRCVSDACDSAIAALRQYAKAASEERDARLLADIVASELALECRFDDIFLIMRETISDPFARAALLRALRSIVASAIEIGALRRTGAVSLALRARQTSKARKNRSAKPLGIAEKHGALACDIAKRHPTYKPERVCREVRQAAGEDLKDEAIRKRYLRALTPMIEASRSAGHNWTDSA